MYTQHTPHLVTTLDLLLKGRLREQSYPFLEGDENSRTQRRVTVSVTLLTHADRRISSSLCWAGQRMRKDER